ncbi:MAG: DUF421 domain-containing protein [Bacteroidota bacterium]
MEQIINIVLRCTVVYIVILVGLRIVGKRHVGQLSILDFVLILLVSNAVQNAMVGDNTTLWGGIIAAGTLLLINYLFSLVFYRWGIAERFFEGTPTLLVHNGDIIKPHLAQEKITEEELERAIREHGIDSAREVKTAIMEADGTISVIGKQNDEHHIETFKHRRMKYQQRKFF